MKPNSQETFFAYFDPIRGKVWAGPYSAMKYISTLPFNSWYGIIPQVDVLPAPHIGPSGSGMKESDPPSSRAVCWSDLGSITPHNVGSITPHKRRQSHDLLTWRYPAGLQ